MKRSVITLLIHTAANIMQPNQIVVFKCHLKTLTHKQQVWIHTIKSSIHCCQEIGLYQSRTSYCEFFFLRGNDVFGVLPAGYEKRLCLICFPFVFKSNESN